MGPVNLTREMPPEMPLTVKLIVAAQGRLLEAARTMFDCSTSACHSEDNCLQKHRQYT